MILYSQHLQGPDQVLAISKYCKSSFWIRTETDIFTSRLISTSDQTSPLVLLRVATRWGGRLQQLGIHIRENCKSTTVTMFLDFKFICLTKSLTNKFIMCNNIVNNEPITIHNVPITESVVSSRALHQSDLSGSGYPEYQSSSSSLVQLENY